MTTGTESESQQVVIDALKAQVRLIRSLLDVADRTIAAYQVHHPELKKTWADVCDDALVREALDPRDPAWPQSLGAKLRCHDSEMKLID